MSESSMGDRVIVSYPFYGTRWYSDGPRLVVVGWYDAVVFNRQPTNTNALPCPGYRFGNFKEEPGGEE